MYLITFENAPFRLVSVFRERLDIIGPDKLHLPRGSRFITANFFIYDLYLSEPTRIGAHKISVVLNGKRLSLLLLDGAVPRGFNIA